MNKTRLRPALESDLEFVCHCARQAYEIYIERIGQPPAPMVADFATSLKQRHLEIVCDDQLRVGFLVSFQHSDHLFVENIAIHPAYQNQGIASKIFGLLEERCQQSGLGAIELYTNQKMTENLAYYAKLGFAETDRRRESGFERVYFRKPL